MSLVPKSAEFHLSRSTYFLIARLLLVALAAALIIALPLMAWARVVGLLCLCVAASWFIVDYRFQRPERLLLLDGATDRWRLLSAAGPHTRLTQEAAAVELELAPNQFVTRHLVIVYFRTEQCKSIVRVLPSDSLSPQEHRLLRRLLIDRSSNRPI